MLPRGFSLAWFSLLLACTPILGQSTPPLVEEVEPKQLRAQCVRLLAVLRESLPASNYKELEQFAGSKEPLSADFGERLQKSLDRWCLIVVTINPESRVKAARGPLPAEVERGKDKFALIKVVNDAGATQRLTVTGEQLKSQEAGDTRRWLEAGVYAKKPLSAKLSGEKLEYLVLRLKAHEAGKREATLKFDIGQGTQDLGFRAEVPILFTVRAVD
jgi:hypothetical protein